jgi:signal-transduction protein with cAMP-binding, CBS, and nucleotidyltransferase domain
MKVRDVMSATPFYCRPDTNLGSAAELLWNLDCGMLIIVNDDQKVIGVVTDRDMFIALGTRNQLPGTITVGAIRSGKVHLCHADDDIHTALATMAREKVRRLPVVNREGQLEGVLSMDDVVAHAQRQGAGRAPDLSFEDIVETLKKVYAPRAPLVIQGRAASA